MSDSLIRAAVIGDPVAHSLSPRMHGYWITQAGVSGSYTSLHVSEEDFASVVRLLPKMGFTGVNVTLPHKEQAARIADVREPLVERIGAANSLTFQADGSIAAANTDAVGFTGILKATLVSRIITKGAALILGAGGAAKAAAAGLINDGWGRIIAINRTPAKAEALARSFPASIVEPASWAELPTLTPQADLIVNATSLGMRGKPDLEISLRDAKPSAVAADIVYTPLETRFLAEARHQGLAVVDGLGMLIHQGAPCFRAWFGAEPVIDETLRAMLVAELGERGR
ncbi:MAG: shikimate dehydrogenase [Pseudomonadota bacterium]